MEHCVLVGSGAIGGMLAEYLGWDGLVIVADGEGGAVTRDSDGVPLMGDGPGGLASLWHNVISLRESLAIDYELTSRLMRQFFGIRRELSEMADWNFVPYVPFRPKIRRYRRLLRDPLTRIIDAGTHLELRLQSGVRVKSRCAVLSAGFFRSLELLEASGLIKRVTSFNNHVVGYGGVIEGGQVATPLVRHSPAGVFFRELCHSSDLSITARPSRFGFSARTASRHQTIYTSTNVGRIIANIVMSGSMGLVSEALFNRFGLFPSARQYNLWVQRRVQVPVDDGATELEAAMRYRSAPFKGEINNVSFQVPSPVSGIHFHGGVAVEQLESRDDGRTYSLCGGKLLLATPIDSRYLYSGHHTFTVVVRYAPRMQSMLDDD